VAGAFDPFEAAARAVLGQQVSVAAGGTIAARLTRQLGGALATPYSSLTHLFPGADAVADATARDLAALGVPASRATTLRSLARAVSQGELSLDAASEPAQLVDQMLALPGVGPWTAHCLAMRGLGWPDAFPEDDLVLRQALGGISGRQARALAERWRPWRAYGATHLWTERGTQRATERRARIHPRSINRSAGASQP
jgi:AraC family transcriptional regulator of adaptative response / DNA-3-methyladenine glycosylase II